MRRWAHISPPRRRLLARKMSAIRRAKPPPVFGKTSPRSEQSHTCCGAIRITPALPTRSFRSATYRGVPMRSSPSADRANVSICRVSRSSFLGCAAFWILWSGKRGFFLRRPSWPKHEQLGKARLAHPGTRLGHRSSAGGHGHCARALLGAGDGFPQPRCLKPRGSGVALPIVVALCAGRRSGSALPKPHRAFSHSRAVSALFASACVGERGTHLASRAARLVLG